MEWISTIVMVLIIVILVFVMRHVQNKSYENSRRSAEGLLTFKERIPKIELDARQRALEESNEFERNLDSLIQNCVANILDIVERAIVEKIVVGSGNYAQISFAYENGIRDTHRVLTGWYDLSVDRTVPYDDPEIFTSYKTIHDAQYVAKRVVEKLKAEGFQSTFRTATHDNCVYVMIDYKIRLD